MTIAEALDSAFETQEVVTLNMDRDGFSVAGDYRVLRADKGRWLVESIDDEQGDWVFEDEVSSVVLDGQEVVAE